MKPGNLLLTKVSRAITLRTMSGTAMSGTDIAMELRAWFAMSVTDVVMVLGAWFAMPGTDMAMKVACRATCVRAYSRMSGADIAGQDLTTIKIADFGMCKMVQK
eukprot:1251625-Rhodomonas_salina.1